jgi:tetratricopeptide (TPR) repeat protein
LTPESLVGFSCGLIGFIVMTSVLCSEGWLTDSAMRTGLFVAGSALLIHNQIEMSFFHEGACVVVMFIVAAAGGGHLHAKVKEIESKEKQAFFYLAAPTAMVALLVMAMTTAAVPMTQYQDQLAQAASQLRDYHDHLEAIGHLEQANRIIPRSPRAWRWRIQLLAELVQGTMQNGQRSRALVMFQHTEKVNDEALEHCPNDLMLMRQMANLQIYAAQWFDQPARKSLALSQWNNIIQYNPYGLSDHLSRADLLWELGRKPDAVEAYENTIMISDQAYLDPDKQLSEKDRNRCLERIRQGKTGK